MKIAILFGSFNPMTNAHLAAMKTAMEALQTQRPGGKIRLFLSRVRVVGYDPMTPPHTCP